MQRPFNPKVVQLSHVVLGVTDISRSRDHYVSRLGLHETAQADGASHLSIGAAHHDIILRPVSEKSFLGLGYLLPPDADMGGFLVEVRAFGLTAERRSDCQPGIADLVQVQGPGGHIFEFFALAKDGPGFGTGGVSPLRLGHVAVVSPEAARLRMFYEDFLGFHYTDDIGGVATFLTCNRDHHVVNLVGLPQSRLHHVAFELAGNAEHATACDRLASSGVPTLWGPARHCAGHNLASYHYDPDRVMVELYTQMDVYQPALNQFEPRPWHKQRPLRPQSWRPDQMTNWETVYGFDLVTA
jgi:catechol-2,3-dioxygenase